MTAADLLTLSTINLSIAGYTWDNYLATLIEASQQMIAREGITLGDTMEDANLIVMYTAYLFRKRAEDNPAMPRMLRYALNNRLLSEKGAVS